MRLDGTRKTPRVFDRTKNIDGPMHGSRVGRSSPNEQPIKRYLKSDCCAAGQADACFLVILSGGLASGHAKLCRDMVQTGFSPTQMDHALCGACDPSTLLSPPPKKTNKYLDLAGQPAFTGCSFIDFRSSFAKLIVESKMDRRTTYFVLCTLSLTSGIAGLPTTSAAEGPIGVAAVVRNNVSQLEPLVTRIAKGDGVVRNEVVRTAADSDARLVFRDDTNLSLGPGSTLKLDRTVFDDPKAGDIAIKLTSGAFRFVTGHSNKEAYEIKTPIVTMGVRGTTLDILVQKRRNTIVLRSGKVTICLIGPNRKCVDLDHEGDTANVTANTKSASIDVQNRSSWTFDTACNGGLCGKSTY
jgi:hypothetical protein